MASLVHENGARFRTRRDGFERVIVAFQNAGACSQHICAGFTPQRRRMHVWASTGLRANNAALHAPGRWRTAPLGHLAPAGERYTIKPPGQTQEWSLRGLVAKSDLGSGAGRSHHASKRIAAIRLRWASQQLESGPRTPAAGFSAPPPRAGVAFGCWSRDCKSEPRSDAPRHRRPP